MRTLIIILAFGVLGCSSSKPITKDFDKFYSKHESDKGVVTLSIPIFLAKMFISKDDKETLKALDKLRKVKLFICEDKKNNYNRTIKDYLPNNVYSDLMVVNNNSEKIVFKMRKPEGKVIEEFVMTVASPKSFVAIELKGSFTKTDISKIVKKLRKNDIKTMY